MKYEKANTQNVANVMFVDDETPKDGYPKRLFDEYVDIEFEGMKFRTIKNYDEFLNMTYKIPYMQLPPPEKRKGVLDAVTLDLLPIKHEDILKLYNKENAKYLEK